MYWADVVSRELGVVSYQILKVIKWRLNWGQKQKQKETSERNPIDFPSSSLKSSIILFVCMMMAHSQFHVKCERWSVNSNQNQIIYMQCNTSLYFLYRTFLSLSLPKLKGKSKEREREREKCREHWRQKWKRTADAFHSCYLYKTSAFKFLPACCFSLIRPPACDLYFLYFLRRLSLSLSRSSSSSSLL